MKAIIDLGTNTFHLVIAEVKSGVISEYFKLQVPVKIGSGGINNGLITQEAFQRGLTALSEFRKYLNQFGVEDVTAFATSAIRNATNGTQFVKEALEKCNIAITTIDGDTEAEYIFRGVQHSFRLPDEKVLVMDIGGGSVEFIIGLGTDIQWKQSFEIGAARLIERFHRENPIGLHEVAALQQFLREQLAPLRQAIELHQPRVLIGSAGSFETLVDVVIGDLAVVPLSLSHQAFEIRREDFDVFVEIMQTSTSEQRSRMKGMAAFRVEMITVAALLMQYVVETFSIKRIIASNYSLKEGVLLK